MSGLGRRVPTDWEHYARFPLTAATTPTAPVPVVLGVNWYEAFDNPELYGGRWWIGRTGSLGHVRGGHCVCIEPGDQLDSAGFITRLMQDSSSWHTFYDQGSEGACVGFGSSRAMSLLNRKRYFARWLWDRAKATDEWSDTNPGDNEGTSVRAAMGILKNLGHVAWKDSYKPLDDQASDAVARTNLPTVTVEGISAYRWATTADAVLAAIKSPASERMGAVRILNSWGASYPRRVWMPLNVLERLIFEDGEAAIPTDR